MTYPPTKCFFLTPTDRYRVELRRYVSTLDAQGNIMPRDECTGGHGYHDASVVLGIETHAEHPSSPYGRELVAAVYPLDDPRWPKTCGACGFAFAEDDKWQVNYRRLHTRSDGGPECDLRSAPPGAMWDATWWPRKGADGRSLVVRLPNGRDWHIDERASNCTLPKDDVHRCWPRHGEPPEIHVDKNGHTCAAGAGSIQAGDYHGFLHHGVLSAG
jgi:hypothetical protein